MGRAECTLRSCAPSHLLAAFPLKVASYASTLDSGVVPAAHLLEITVLVLLRIAVNGLRTLRLSGRYLAQAGGFSPSQYLLFSRADRPRPSSPPSADDDDNKRDTEYD